jgi:hypothetical protein
MHNLYLVYNRGLESSEQAPFTSEIVGSILIVDSPENDPSIVAVFRDQTRVTWWLAHPHSQERRGDCLGTRL